MLTLLTIFCLAIIIAFAALVVVLFGAAALPLLVIIGLVMIDLWVLKHLFHRKKKEEN